MSAMLLLAANPEAFSSLRHLHSSSLSIAGECELPFSSLA